MKFAAAIVAGLAFAGAAFAEPAVEVHFPPVENLEKIDVDAIGRARKSIDMAAYVLSDWAIIEALQAAEKRGVQVRIVLDTGQRPHQALARLHAHEGIYRGRGDAAGWRGEFQRVGVQASGQ